MVSITHLLNDMMQSVIPAVYPLLKEKFDFTFAQIGLITLVFQLTSSLLQPVAGLLADRHPRPYSLAGGMCFTLAGLLVLAFAPGFCLDSDCGGADRLRFVGVPSRILAGGATCLGRP
jgi:Major Facilitator Superfamily.